MKITKLKLVVVILLLILLAKIIVTLVALPKASIDYVAQYNELTKPENYSPENNAADDYLKAINLYIEPSEELNDSMLMVKWDEGRTAFQKNIDPNELTLLANWIKINEPALAQIKKAIQKPYCWFERESDNGNTLGIRFPESSNVRDIVKVFLYSAKLKARNNEMQSAIDAIIDCYHIGRHQCRENSSLMEQFLGIRIKRDSMEVALDMLANSKPTTEVLEYFQQSLYTLVSNEAYTLGLGAEKLFLYDRVQHVYLDWIRGINKPSFRVLFGIRCMCGDLMDNSWVNAFVGPSRNEMLHEIDQFIELYDPIRDKTPWQIQHQYKDHLSKIENIKKNNFFLNLFSPSYNRFYLLSHKSNAEMDALITILAILRFKADNNRLPETLEDLVSNRYMKYLPQDPYSESALVYRIDGDAFSLYSLGKNYEDNGGKTVIIEEDSVFGLNRSAPPINSNSQHESGKMIKRTVYKDFVLWPVTKIPEYVEPPKI